MGAFEEIKRKTVERCNKCIWAKHYETWTLCSMRKCRYFKKLNLINELAKSLKRNDE